MISKRTTISVFAFESIAIIMAIGMGFSAGDPLKHFGEFYFITWFSFAQLLFLFVLSRKIFGIHISGKTEHILRSTGFIWAVVAYGFFSWLLTRYS